MAFSFDSTTGLSSYLTPVEKLRLERMKSPSRRSEMMGSFEVRRALISEMTGCRPQDVVLDTQADGAPVLLAPAGWSVSLANKGGYTLVALAPETVVMGVDIEIVCAMAWRPVLSMTSSEGERLEIEAAANEIDSDIRLFFRMWTLKEAVLKSTGRGFRAGPKAVETPMAILRTPGTGTLSAFGEIFDFWTADAGDTIVSLARKRI